MAKQVSFDEEARHFHRQSMDMLAEEVKVTLGAKGRNMVLDKKLGGLTVINDGVTIAREIALENPCENMEAQLLKEAARPTM